MFSSMNSIVVCTSAVDVIAVQYTLPFSLYSILGSSRLLEITELAFALQPRLMALLGFGFAREMCCEQPEKSFACVAAVFLVQYTCQP